MSCYCSPEREVPSELWLGEGGEREAWPVDKANICRVMFPHIYTRRNVCTYTCMYLHEGEVPTEVWLVEGQGGGDGEGSWSVVGRLIATISLFSVCMT